MTCWVQTFSGRALEPLNPNLDDIRIEDIAHGLSMLCRFTGQCKKFYSIAEHSILVSFLLPDELKFTGLMHDASEAYLNDINKPVKNELPDYKRIEYIMEKAISDKFNLVYPFPDIVKEQDAAVLMAEQKALMGPQVKDWCIRVKPADVVINCYPPDIAEKLFLLQYKRLLMLNEVLNGSKDDIILPKYGISPLEKVWRKND